MSADVDRLTLSLTGPDSHVVRREAGVGNMYVGPRAQRANVPQAIVPAGARPSWDVIDTIPRAGAYPWPRWLTYEGDDVGVFGWLARRPHPLESLELVTTAPMVADAAKARVGALRIESSHALRLVVPSDVRLSLRGALDGIHVEAAGRGAKVDLTLDPRRGRLVVTPGLASVQRLTVRGMDVDLGALATASHVRELTLVGTMKNLAALAALRGLERLSLREVWDLSGLPPWSAWPKLKQVSLFGVRGSDAKRLAKTAEERPSIVLVVRSTRTDAWIDDPANRPRFEGWSVPARTLKAANAAFAAATVAVAKLKKAEPKRARAIVDDFVDQLNTLHAKKGSTLTTLEREDVAEAVASLFDSDLLGPLRDDALAWLDAKREF